MGRFYKPAQQQTPIDYMSKLPEELLINTLNVVEGRIDAADNILAEDLAALKIKPIPGIDEDLYKTEIENIEKQITELQDKYHKDPMNFTKYKYDLMELRKGLKENWERGNLFKIKKQSDIYYPGMQKYADVEDFRGKAMASYITENALKDYKGAYTSDLTGKFIDLPKDPLEPYLEYIKTAEKDVTSSTTKEQKGYFDTDYTTTTTALDEQKMLKALYDKFAGDGDAYTYYNLLNKAGITREDFDPSKQLPINMYTTPKGVRFELNPAHPDYGSLNAAISQKGRSVTTSSDIRLTEQFTKVAHDNLMTSLKHLEERRPYLYINGKRGFIPEGKFDKYLYLDEYGSIMKKPNVQGVLGWEDLPVNQTRNIGNTQIGKETLKYLQNLESRTEKPNKAFGGAIYANGGTVDDPPPGLLNAEKEKQESLQYIANAKKGYKKPTTSKTDNAGSGSLDALSYRETGFHFFYNPIDKPKDLSEVMKDYKATKDALEIEESKGKVNQSTLEALAEREQDVLAIRETVKNFFPNSKDFDDKWDLFYNTMVGEKNNFYNSPERIIKYGTKKSDVLKTWSEKGFTYDDSKYVAMAISMDKKTFVADFENMLDQTERIIFEKTNGNISDLIVIDEETGETYYSPKFLKIASNMLEGIVDTNYSIGQGNTTRQRLYESALNFNKDLLSKNEQNEQKQIYSIAEKFRTVESVNKINKIKIPELLLNDDFYSYVAEPVMTTIEDTKYPIEADDIKIYDFLTDEETKRTFRGSNFDVENLRNTYGKNFSDIFDFVSVGYDEDGLYLVGKMKQNTNKKQKKISTFERTVDFMNSINPVTSAPSLYRNIPNTNYPTQYKFVINNPDLKGNILLALEDRVDKVAKRDADKIAKNTPTFENVTKLINIIKYPNIYSQLQKTLQDMIYSGSEGMVSDFNQVKSFSFRSDDGKETYNIMVSPVNVNGKIEYKMKGQLSDGTYFPIETYIGKQADGEEIYKDSYINTETMLNAIVNAIFPPKQENKK